MSLIDQKPRSADARANGNVELIALSREDFVKEIAEDPTRSRALLGILAERLRRMDDLAMILAYGSEEERLEYILRGLRDKARPDPKRPGWSTLRAGICEIAKMAGVSEAQAQAFLEHRARQGELEISSHLLRFKDTFTLLSLPSRAG